MNSETRKATIILASSSPRRRELLALTGWQAVISPVDVEEQPRPSEPARTLALRLAVEKARVSARTTNASGIIVAADTVVSDEDRLLGKPADPADAERMLTNLRGREHMVVTAIVIIDRRNGLEIEEACETIVPMRDYSAEELMAYIASGAPMDKAGAYGIQDDGFHPVALSRLHGCYTNVMGLPLCHLVRAMHRLGERPHQDVPVACQAHTEYTCPVYSQIVGDLA